MSQEHDILAMLADEAIVVGSAVNGRDYNDIDLVVSAKGLAIAKKILPDAESCFPGHIKTFETDTPIECFRYWYGPGYSDLKKRKLGSVILCGIKLRAWGGRTEKKHHFTEYGEGYYR